MTRKYENVLSLTGKDLDAQLTEGSTLDTVGFNASYSSRDGLPKIKSVVFNNDTICMGMSQCLISIGCMTQGYRD